MTLRQVTQFARETGLLNESFGTYDVMHCFKQMREYHRDLTKKASIAIAVDNITLKYHTVSSMKREEEISELQQKIAAQEKHIKEHFELNAEQVDKIKSEIELMKQEVERLQVAPLLEEPDEKIEKDNVRFNLHTTPGTDFLDDFYKVQNGQEDILFDSKQPLTESDFVEMIVRMIILASSKPGYALTSGSHEIQCIYDAIFKFLSKKLLPLYTNVTKREQDNSFR